MSLGLGPSDGEIRPQWAGLPKYSATQTLLIGFGALTLARHPKLFPFAVTLAILFAAIFLATWGAYHWVARIRVEADSVSLPSRWLGAQLVPISDVRRVAQRSVKTGWSRRPSQRLIFVGASNRSLSVIRASHWKSDDVLALAVQLGWTTDSGVGVEDGRTLEAELPGSTNYWDRHPDAAQIAMAAGLIGIGVAGYLIFGPA